MCIRLDERSGLVLNGNKLIVWATSFTIGATFPDRRVAAKLVLLPLVLCLEKKKRHPFLGFF